MQSYSVKVILQAIDKATGPIRKVTQAVEKLSKVAEMTRFTKSFSNIGSSISQVGNEAGVLAARLTGLGAAGVGLFAAFIRPSAQMESFRMTLTNLYGSATKARGAMGWLQSYAAKSPYSFNQLLESMTLLKQVGIEPLNGSLKHLMDFFASMGVTQDRSTNATLALTQAWAKGKLQGDDIKQLVNANIPIWKLLSEVTGKNTKELMKMSSAGEIGQSILQKLFDLMGQKGLKGAEKMAFMWSTLTSNLGDKWQIFADKIMNLDLGGGKTVFNMIKSDVAAIGGLMDKYMKPENAKKVAVALKEIYSAAKELVVKGIIPVSMELFKLGKAFSAFVGGPANAIKVLIGLMSMPLVASILNVGFVLSKTLWTFTGLITSAEALWAALGIGIAVFEAITAPITLVIAGVVALAGAAVLVYKNWNGISSWFMNLWRTWGGATRFVLPGVSALVDLAEVIVQNWSPIQQFFASIMNGIQQSFALAAKVIVMAWEPAINTFKTLLNLASRLSGMAFNGLKNLPNMNAFTGQVSFGKPTQAKAHLGPAIPLAKPGGQQISVKPKKDVLEVAMKVDFAGRPQITSVKSKGDSQVDFLASMGLMTS